MEIITEKEEILYRFIENADKCDHRDRGIEGWFQTELIAKLWDGKPIQHHYKGPDLSFSDGYEIELKMTTCFRPDWITDGMIKDKRWTPVLFFSGYLHFWKSEKNQNPEFEDKKDIRKWFEKEIHKKYPNIQFDISFTNTIELMNNKKKKVLIGIIEKT
jgi:hypothetical protein